jgi:hypothetical protein
LGKQTKIETTNFDTIYSHLDSTFLNTNQSNTLLKIKPLTKGDFTYEQDVLLDITSLQRGQYYVHYLSCGLGGIFPLTIK